MRPLFDRVLIRPIEAESMTSSGLHIPDGAKEKPQQGEVVAIGTGKTRGGNAKHDFSVKVGDKVLFGKFSGTEIRLNGELLRIMREEDILLAE